MVGCTLIEEMQTTTLPERPPHPVQICVKELCLGGRPGPRASSEVAARAAAGPMPRTRVLHHASFLLAYFQYCVEESGLVPPAVAVVWPSLCLAWPTHA